MDTTRETIRQLAGTNEEADDLSIYEELPAEFKEALEERLADEKKEIAKRHADLILTLLRDTARRKGRYVSMIRELRRRVRQQIIALKWLEDTINYGRATNDFEPLYVEMNYGGTHPDARAQREKVRAWKDQQSKSDEADGK